MDQESRPDQQPIDAPDHAPSQSPEQLPIESTYDNPTTRAVAFPNHDEIEERPIAAMRPKGAEMKREITMEDKELAAAGYEHLEEHKAKKLEKDKQLEHVDVFEHRLSFAELESTLKTSINSKEPGKTFGLTIAEAAARLARDGRNVLTPPKKKSALRKVLYLCCPSHLLVAHCHPVLGLPPQPVQYPPHGRRRLAIHFAGHLVQGIHIAMTLGDFFEFTIPTAKFPELVSRWHSHQRGTSQWIHRVLSASKVGSHSCLLPGHDTTLMSGRT